MSKDIADYKIGDEMYRYVEVGGIFKYLVFGIRNYDGEVQLEVESQSCSHGYKCKILVAQNDYKKLFSVHMLNNDEDDDQRHWNSHDHFHFWPTVNEAKIEALKHHIAEQTKSVSEVKSAYEYRQKCLKDLTDAFELIEPKEAK